MLPNRTADLKPLPGFDASPRGVIRPTPIEDCHGDNFRMARDSFVIIYREHRRKEE